MNGFDSVSNGQLIPITFSFFVDPGTYVTGASLTLGLMSAGGSTTSDKIYIEDTSRAYGWGDLSVAAPTTTP